MSHAIWKGSISFGLVNIPIGLFPAENHKEIHFHLYDKKDHSKIGYQYFNKMTGKPVKRSDLVKGYELENGKFIEVNESMLKNIAGENTKNINIEKFVDRDSIDLIDFDTPYFLVPDKKGEKGYVLLRDVLMKTKKIGLAKVIIHSTEKLAAVIPYENALILNALRFHNELKHPKDVGIDAVVEEKVKISPNELKVAEKLIESMTESWEPNSYQDNYQIALKAWLKEREKVSKPAIKMDQKPLRKKIPNKMINLTDLLKKSMPRTSNHKRPKNKAG